MEPGTSNQFSRFLSLISSRLSGHWLLDIIGITVAVISLAASLASLIWLGVRTYKLSVSSAVNGAVSACAGLIQVSTIHAVFRVSLITIQANLATLETITPKCKGILAQGATPSPYQLGKRALHASLTAGSGLLERRRYTKICTVPTGGCEYVEISVFDLNSGAILVCAVLVFGGLLLVFARRKSRIGGVFHSPARSDVQVTRHNQEGTETITGQSVKSIKQNPGDYQYAGQLRQRIRNVQNQNENDSKDGAAWQPYNCSTDTLISPWTGPNPSKVSITNGSADEKHEGLIELETTGGNKAFFDPETGQFVHLTPWKSTHSDGEESDDDHSLKADDKGSIKSALAHMATGGAAWAGGKDVDDMLKMKIREADKRIEKVEIPQRAGDSLAGQVTNERLSGWPQTV